MNQRAQMWKYHGLFYRKMYHKTVDARLIVNCAIVPQMCVKWSISSCPWFKILANTGITL